MKLIEAVEAVRSGRSTIYQASKTYHIPKETLRRHVKDEVQDFQRPGRNNLLSEEEESALVQYIQYNARHNFPLKRQDLRSVVLVCTNGIHFISTEILTPYSSFIHAKHLNNCILTVMDYCHVILLINKLRDF